MLSVRTTRYSGTLAALAILCAITPVSAFAQPLRIGGNSYLLGGSGRNYEFPDQYRHGRYGAPNTPRAGSAPLGADGWPTGDFSLSLFFDTDGVANLAGAYRVSFESAALPNITLLQTPGTLTPFTLNAQTQRWEATATLPDNPINFNLRFLSVTTPVRNIRVLRPGFTGAETFALPFVNHLATFGTLRYLGWSNTNNSNVVNWSDNSSTSYARWSLDTLAGVPWEVCIDAANAADSDMWITVPHKATDAYVTQLATLIRDRLEPGRRVFVEYSNELWNFSFQQTSWNRAQAIAEVNAGGSNLVYDGQTDDRFWYIRRAARRTLEISTIFGQVFGPGSRNTRFLPVLSGRCWLTDELADALTYIKDNYGSPATLIHAIAVAPYIYINFGDEPAGSLTKDQILDYLQTDLNNLPTNANFEAFRALCQWHGINLLGYEVGPDTAGPNNIPAKIAAHHDARMRQICRDYLTLLGAWGFEDACWSAWGAGTFNSPFGSWGLSEDISTINAAPKALALADVRAASPPPLTGGVALPGLIDARRHAFRSPSWQNGPFLILTGSGQHRDYLVRVDGTSPRPAAFFPAAATVQPGGVPLCVWVDGVAVHTITVPASGNDAVFVETAPAAITLAPGWHTLRIEQLGPGQVNMSSIRFACPGDYNADGQRSPTDLFFYLNLYFTGSGRADFDSTPGLTPADIFAFLNAYFAGC